MAERMPCHISDGPQTPEDAAEYWDSIFNRLESDDLQEHRKYDWMLEEEDDERQD